MRHLVLILVLLLASGATQARLKRQSVDKQMAEIIAEVGLKRLADDRNDYLGKELIRLAQGLDSKNAKADIGRDVIAGSRGVPKDLDPAYSEEELADFMLKRADYLLKNKLKTDKAYSALCLAYVSAASALKPNDPRSDKYLLALKQFGISIAKREAAAKKATGPVVPEGANPPVKHNLGLGCGPEQIHRLYGKTRAKSSKGDVETLYLGDDRGLHAAEFHNGICRRLNLSIDKEKIHLYLGLFGKSNDDWKRQGKDRWRSKCGNFIAYYDEHGKLEASFIDIYEKRHAALAAAQSDSGPTETIGAAAAGIKYRIVDYGIGTAYLDLKRRFAKMGKREYIKRPSEYVQEFKNLNGDKRTWFAYIHYARCRRMKTSVGNTKSKSKDGGKYDAAVNKILDIQETEDDGWEKKSDTRWDSKDGKFIASVTAGWLSIWERDWYENHRD